MIGYYDEVPTLPGAGFQCAREIAERADTRIAALESAIAVRDTEIARLETDLDLARREVVRLKNKCNATFDAIHEHTSRAATKRIFAAVKEFDPAARAGNGGGV